MDLRNAVQRALSGFRPAETRRADRNEPDEAVRILVAVDDRRALDEAERLLIADGYVPVLTGASHSVLQLARSVRPGAIVLDVLMPGFDGWDVLAALKADPQTTAIPVLMVCMLGERGRALEAGAKGAVSKPLDGATLSMALAEALRGTARARAVA